VSVTTRRAPVEYPPWRQTSAAPAITPEDIIMSRPKPTAMSDLFTAFLHEDCAHRVTLWLADAMVNDTSTGHIDVLPDFYDELSDSVARAIGWDRYFGIRGDLVWRGAIFKKASA
jgi:hypothetical protein